MNMQVERFSNFVTVEPKKVGDFVFEQLEETILLKEVLPGEQLPTERDLADIFKVSRITIRNAIEQLLNKGLVEKRRGAKGGTFVMPITSNVKKKTRSWYQNNKEEFLQLLEYRLIIEPETVRVAAQRITEPLLLELSKSVFAPNSVCERETFRAYDIKFHLTIAKASHNLFLEQSVRKIRTKLSPGLDLIDYNEAVINSTYHDHQEILNALSAKDSEKAFELSRNHIIQTASILKRVLQ